MQSGHYNYKTADEANERTNARNWGMDQAGNLRESKYRAIGKMDGQSKVGEDIEASDRIIIGASLKR